MASTISAPPLLPAASPPPHPRTSSRRRPTMAACASIGSPSLSLDECRINRAVWPVHQQQELTFTPSTGHFYSLLQKCIQDEDTILGKEVRSKIVENGLKSDSFLGSHLIRMFTVFGDLCEANEVFKGLSDPTVYAWSAIISAHANLGCGEHAIELYFEMRASTLEPDGHVFVAILQACASSASLINGITVHNDIIETGLDSQIFVGNTLIDMYAKCGSLQDACIIFKRLPERDVVTWNAMIGGFGQHGHVQEALHTFTCMSRQGFQPDSVSFVCCLSACSNSAALEQGKEMHTYIVTYGFDADLQVDIALIDMFIKCGCLHDARAVFDKGRKDVRIYESMAMMYFQHGHDHEVLELLQEMQEKGMLPTVKTFISSLRACSSIGDLDQGWKIHSDIVKSGLEYDIFVGNTLIDVYGKCQSLGDAQAVFDRLQFQDVVSWSALISGYAMHGQSEEAIRIFKEMQNQGLKPNEISFTCVLKACSGTEILDNSLEDGRWIHSLIIGNGFERNIMLGTALVDMYAKCGNLDDACMVVEKLPEQDVVTWSALITGFTLHGYGQEALQSFKTIQRKAIEPIPSMLVSVLKACSLVAALEQAKQIHGYIIYRGMESEIIGSALIDMYAKCGSLTDACAVFDSLHSRDIITWGTMMASFSQHNDYMSAIKCFKDMKEDGLLPNDVIFTCLLTACSHANQLEEGCQHFKSMREHYGILPALEHYYSVVELLGHGGRFDEAEDLIESVPFQSNIVGWISLLASCRRHGNVKLGERCFQHAIRINPGYSSEYMLMWNLYSGAGLLDDARNIEELRITANAWKKPAKAFIEVDNDVHSFVVADKTHPRSKDIYAKLKCLTDKVKNEGKRSVPDLGSDKDEEDVISVHSEKLAIAFGLISTPEGSTIRLSKNLRVCADCHSSAKAISKVEKREIIIADAYQIHHFQNGSCSCVNFW